MPKFGTTCKSYYPDHPDRIKNRMYAATYYAKHGHTQEYKDRKKRERERRKEMKKYQKLMEQVNMQQSSETTTARSEICC